MTGDALAKEVDLHTKQLVDEEVLHYLNEIENKLAGGSALDECFVVKVIDDPEPNAYSLPGGFLYLTTGLFRIAESESQIAAALAHETAHVRAKHLTRLDARRRHWGRLALLGGPAGLVLRHYVGPLLTLKMARDFELAADRRALQYYTSAGYEPKEFTAILRSAFMEGDESKSFADRVWDTHPPTLLRIKLLEQSRQHLRVPVKPDSEPQRAVMFAQIKARVAFSTPAVSQ